MLRKLACLSRGTARAGLECSQKKCYTNAGMEFWRHCMQGGSIFNGSWPMLPTLLALKDRVNAQSPELLEPWKQQMSQMLLSSDVWGTPSPEGGTDEESPDWNRWVTNENHSPGDSSCKEGVAVAVSPDAAQQAAAAVANTGDGIAQAVVKRESTRRKQTRAARGDLTSSTKDNGGAAAASGAAGNDAAAATSVASHSRGGGRQKAATGRGRALAGARRAYHPYSESEISALHVGVARHGVGKWKEILSDPSLPFLTDGVRTVVDLKDKWRHLDAKRKREEAKLHFLL